MVVCKGVFLNMLIEEQFNELMHYLRTGELAWSGNTSLPIGFEGLRSAFMQLRLPDKSAAVRDLRVVFMLPDAHGLYNPVTRVVTVETSACALKMMQVMLHETAHALLHHDIMPHQYKVEYDWIEAEANLTALLASKLLGLPIMMSAVIQIDRLQDDVPYFCELVKDRVCKAAVAIKEALHGCGWNRDGVGGTRETSPADSAHGHVAMDVRAEDPHAQGAGQEAQLTQ